MAELSSGSKLYFINQLIPIQGLLYKRNSGGTWCMASSLRGRKRQKCLQKRDGEWGSESEEKKGKELNKCDRGRGFDCKKRNGRAGTKINCIYFIHWSYDVVIDSLQSYVILLPWPCLQFSYSHLTMISLAFVSVSSRLFIMYFADISNWQLKKLFRLSPPISPLLHLLSLLFYFKKYLIFYYMSMLLSCGWTNQTNKRDYIFTCRISCCIVYK